MNQFLTCPKCHQAMQSFTRSGLTIEQCSHCRGVFLDYGELERLVQMEGQYYQQQHMPPPAAPPLGAAPPVQHGHVRYHGHAFGHQRHGHYRKSLLGELFFD
jgi:uncharacterized protein